MRSVLNAVILNGQTMSAAVDCGLAGSLAGLIAPAGFSTADITVQGSIDGETYYPLYDEVGTAVGATAVVASTMRAVNPVAALPARFVKLVSSVAVGADTTLQVIARQFV